MAEAQQLHPQPFTSGCPDEQGGPEYDNLW